MPEFQPLTDSETADVYRRALARPLYVNRNGIPVFSVSKPGGNKKPNLKWKMKLPQNPPRIRRRFEPRPAEYAQTEKVYPLIERDGHICCYCGIVNRRLTVDHVIPKKHGGKDDLENYVAACQVCNTNKAARTPLQWLIEMIN